MPAILCRGFRPSDIPLARVEGAFDRSLPIYHLQDSDLSKKLGEISQLAQEGTEASDEQDAPYSGQKFVIVDGDKSLLNSIMKGFKAAVKAKRGEIIFAMLTDTAREWKLGSYFEELSAEHKEMSQYKGQLPESSLHENQ